MLEVYKGKEAPFSRESKMGGFAGTILVLRNYAVGNVIDTTRIRRGGGKGEKLLEESKAAQILYCGLLSYVTCRQEIKKRIVGKEYRAFGKSGFFEK